MIGTILHRRRRFYDEHVPESVRTLDVLMTERLLRAKTVIEQNRALDEKLHTKRRLLNVPADLLDAEAAAIVSAIQGQW